MVFFSPSAPILLFENLLHVDLMMKTLFLPFHDTLLNNVS